MDRLLSGISFFRNRLFSLRVRLFPAGIIVISRDWLFSGIGYFQESVILGKWLAGYTFNDRLSSRTGYFQGSITFGKRLLSELCGSS